MTYEEAIHRIESIQFSVEVNVVSSLASFVNAIRREEAVRLLVREMRSQPHVWRDVCARIIQLRMSPIDPQYENPHDVSLATYVLSSEWFNGWAGRFAARLVSNVQNTWWARRVAALVLKPQVSRTTPLRIGELFPTATTATSLRSNAVTRTFMWDPVPRDTPISVVAPLSPPVKEFAVAIIEAGPNTELTRYKTVWTEQAA
jgi:hypothetical protein